MKMPSTHPQTHGCPGVQQNSISIDYREEVDYLVDTGIVDLSDAPMGITQVWRLDLLTLVM